MKYSDEPESCSPRSLFIRSRLEKDASELDSEGDCFTGNIAKKERITHGVSAELGYMIHPLVNLQKAIEAMAHRKF